MGSRSTIMVGVRVHPSHRTRIRMRRRRRARVRRRVKGAVHAKWVVVGREPAMA